MQNHPIYDFVKEKIDKQTASKLEEVLKESRIEKVKRKNANFYSRDKMEKKESNTNNNENEKSQESYMKYLFCSIIDFICGNNQISIFNRVKGA